MPSPSDKADVERGFWLGVTVAKYVYGIGDRADPVVAEGVLGTLLAIAQGDLTLTDNPHEIVTRLPHLADLVPDAAARLHGMLSGPREAERDVAKQIVASVFRGAGLPPPE